MNRKQEILVFIIFLAGALGLIYFLRYPVAYYLSIYDRRVFLSHLALGMAAAVLILVGWRHRNQVVICIKGFFWAPSHPLNLAIFRIVLFGVMLRQLDAKNVITFSGFSKASMVIPTGMGWILPYIPINEDFAAKACIVFFIFCCMAIAGLFSRFSAFMAALTGIYVLGIPQFFGKVNHYHHLIWFAMIMASCRCGDYLSIDAAIRFLRDKKRSPAAPSVEYGLPLRIIWLLFGVIYFFPGYWKWMYAGFDWVMSDNLKYWIYSQWANEEVFNIIYRIDLHPILIRIAAIMTIIFEMGFIFLIFSPRLRYAAVLGGLIFHQSTHLFLGILFKPLQYCYVVFFDWFKILNTLSQKIFHRSLPMPPPVKTDWRKLLPVILVGILLILTNTVFGFKSIRNGWPFACYPTFQWIQEGVMSMLEMETVRADGSIFTLKEWDMGRRIRSERVRGKIEKVLIIRDPELKRRKLEALWQDWVRVDDQFQDVRTVYFFESTFLNVSTLERKQNISRVLLHKMVIENKEIIE